MRLSIVRDDAGKRQSEVQRNASFTPLIPPEVNFVPEFRRCVDACERLVLTMDRDYVLGTHDEELARLGLQHRVWRPVVLDCWQRAGITVGKRVLDVGAGPGYATVDLAEIVGPTGEIVALERSENFIRAMEQACRARSLANVKIHQLDLMTDGLPKGNYDFSWCRWVMSFVNDPALFIRKLSDVMRSGSLAIFHEYGHYETWHFFPRLVHQERFREHVIATWRESGGEPDGAVALATLLPANGFTIRSARPHLFCVRPTEYMWQWPATFIETYLPRLIEMGRIDQQFADKVRADLTGAEKNPNALMITPLVLEIVAEKIG
jgi:SAM-dependent methyltransferase